MFLFFYKCNISNDYRAIIPPTPKFLWISAPKHDFFFISQHGEFETQPTQTTFTVWQMKLINNLKHALTVAHTIMSLNMFLPARERDASQLLPAHISPVVYIKVQKEETQTLSYFQFYFTIPQCNYFTLYSTIHALPCLQSSNNNSICRLGFVVFVKLKVYSCRVFQSNLVWVKFLSSIEF